MLSYQSRIVPQRKALRRMGIMRSLRSAMCDIYQLLGFPAFDLTLTILKSFPRVQLMNDPTSPKSQCPRLTKNVISSDFNPAVEIMSKPLDCLQWTVSPV